MDDQLQITQNPEQTYNTIRQSIVRAQHTMAAAVNTAMVIRKCKSIACAIDASQE